MLRKSEVRQDAFISRGQDGTLPWIITRVVGARFEARTLDGATATVFRIDDPSLTTLTAQDATKSINQLIARYRRMRRVAQTSEGKELADTMLAAIKEVKVSLKSRHFNPLT